MIGSARSRSRSASTSRDFPIPGSPKIRTICPARPCASRQRDSMRSSSSSRPTSGVDMGSVQRLEPALCPAFADDPPRRHWVRETLKLQSTELNQFE